MKFIKMDANIDGASFDPKCSNGTLARYVRANVLDEIIISVFDSVDYQGKKTGEKIYAVEGVVYTAEDYQSYLIKDFDTFEQAQKYLYKLLKMLDLEFVSNDTIPLSDY